MGIRGDYDHGFNLNINERSAQKIVHVVSEDEIRKNFRLESLYLEDGKTIEANMEEFSRAGVHSDIGGGYGELDMERKFVVKSDERSYKYKDDAESNLKRYEEEANEKGYELFHELRHQPGMNHWYLELTMVESRKFGFGLSNLYLNEMYNRIKEFGVELVDLDLLGESRGGFSNYKVPDQLDDTYVHVSHSDDWYNASMGDLLANKAEENGERTVYYNEPDRAV